MKIPVILQARFGSTRLPGKVLLPLAGKATIRYVLEALLAAKSVETVIVAVPEDSVSGIKPIVEEYGCHIMSGSEEDVLGRFVAALDLFPADHIVRATADNPFVSPGYIDKIVALHHEQNADLSHYLGIPLGSGVEVVRSQALYEAAASSDDPYHREHVTPYLYAHPEKYTILEPQLSLEPDLRLTVDTAEDFARAERIVGELYKGKPLPLHEILALFKSKPELFR